MKKSIRFCLKITRVALCVHVVFNVLFPKTLNLTIFEEIQFFVAVHIPVTRRKKSNLGDNGIRLKLYFIGFRALLSVDFLSNF